MSFRNLVTFPKSKNASVSSRIKIGDLDARESEYCNAKEAIDFSPPDSCSKS